MVPAQLKVRANREDTKDPSRFSLSSDPSSRLCLQRNQNSPIYAKINKPDRSEKGGNGHTVVSQISAKTAQFLPMLGRWGTDTHPPVFPQKRTHPTREGRVGSLQAARPLGFSGERSPEEEPDSTPQGRALPPLPAAFPLSGQGCSRGLLLTSPFCSLWREARGGPQLGWPATQVSPHTLLSPLHHSLRVTQQSSGLLLQQMGTGAI